MKTRNLLTVTIALVAVPVILAILARNDLGEARFYGALELAAIVLVACVLGVALGAFILAFMRVRAEGIAKIEAARRTSNERHIYHERTHTIDGRGTFNVAGGDPLAYPDLVRSLLNTQQQAPASPQLGAGIPVQLPTPQQPARRLEDVVPVLDEAPGWTPYANMAGEW